MYPPGQRMPHSGALRDDCCRYHFTTRIKMAIKNLHSLWMSSFYSHKFSENVLWTVVIQKYFQVLFFSITWHSKLVDSLGKTLVVFCHCRCESREENLFWEADYYIIAVACSGQSLSLFSCLLSYMIYSTPADCKYKHSVVDGFFYISPTEILTM